MDFLDRVSKTFSDTGQKAKDMADIAGFNSKISDNEKEIKKLYEQLGEAYYNAHSNDPEEDLKETVEGITGLKDEINDWNEQIQKLKGFIKCPDCGEYVEKDALKCPNCGHSFLPEGAVICPGCGAVITEPDVMFCQYCGAALERQPQPETPDTAEPETADAATPDTSGATEPETTDSTEPGTPEPETTNATKPDAADTLEPGCIRCKCGAILHKNDKFCPQCGTSRAELEKNDSNPQ